MTLAERDFEVRPDEILELDPTLLIPEVEGASEDDPVKIIRPSVAIVNTFAQHRNGRNQRQSDLDASIEASGGHLHYQVDVCSLTYDQASDYLEFTNRLWGAERSIDEFVQYHPGQYLFLIAGHSRLISVKNYAQKHNIDFKQQPIKAQLRDITSVSEFLDMQVRENIHSAPPPERAARAYAECYLYELDADPSLTQAEFCRQKGIKDGALRDALWYADLPVSIRQITDSGQLPFSLSVELAKAAPVLRQEAERAALARGEDTAQLHKEIDTVVHDELMRFISLFNGRLKRHVTNTRAHIRTHVDGLRKKQLAEQEAQELEMSLFDARSFDRTAEVLRTEIVGLVQELGDHRGISQRNLHNSVSKIMNLAGLEIDPTEEDATIHEAAAVLKTVVPPLLEAARQKES